MRARASLNSYEIPFPAVTLEKRGETCNIGIDNSKSFFDAAQKNIIDFVFFLDPFLFVHWSISNRIRFLLL